VTMSKSRRIELAAMFIMALWVVAWVVSLSLKVEVPMPLNAAMPMASAVLLGFQLPIDTKKKGE
jgi:hypothetical protein